MIIPLLTQSSASWNDLFRRRRWYLRTNLPGRHCGAGTDSSTRQIRRNLGLHHHPILPFRSVGTIDCFTCRLEMVRPPLRPVGCSRLFRNPLLLLPSSPTKLSRPHTETDRRRDRLCRRRIVHQWHDRFPSWLAMGWLSVSLALCPCHRPSRRWCSSPFCCLPHLGNKICQISHVPGTHEARGQNFRPNFTHYRHLRCQFLLCHHVLANTGFQRLWT